MQFNKYTYIHTYVATFTTVSIVSKRLITPVITMLPPCSSSLVSSSHFYDETITNRHPRNDALALLSPPSVVLQKGGRGHAVVKARCLSLVHASAENREHSLHEGGGRLNQGNVFRYTIPVRYLAPIVTPELPQVVSDIYDGSRKVLVIFVCH